MGNFNQKAFEEMVGRQVIKYSKYANVPTPAVSFDNMPLCIDLAKNIMHFPTVDIGKDPHFLNFGIPHEIGHPGHCPKTAHWGLWAIMAAEKFGYDNPQDIANVIVDLFDNEWNATQTPWRGLFRPGQREFYNGLKKKAQDNRARFLAMMSLTRLDELAGKTPDINAHGSHPDNADWVHVYNLLYHDDRRWQDRYHDILYRLQGTCKYVEQEQPEESSGTSFSTGNSSGSYRKKRGRGKPDNKPQKPDQQQEESAGMGDRDKNTYERSQHAYEFMEMPGNEDEEMEDWRKAIKALPKESIERMIRQMAGGGAGTHKGRKMSSQLAFDLAATVAWSEFMAFQDYGRTYRSITDGPKIERPWEMRDPIDALDVKASISRYGVLIPEETTLKTILGPERPSYGPAEGILFLCLDLSGSMQSYAHILLEVAWGSVLAARKAGDKVGILAFESVAEYLLDPTKDYNKAKSVLEKLSIDGGTYLIPGLQSIVENAKKKRFRPTVLVISDCDIYDHQNIDGRATEIKKLGGNMLICNTQNGWEEKMKHYPPGYNWTRRLEKSGLALSFEIKSVGDIRTVIKATHDSIIPENKR